MTGSRQRVFRRPARDGRFSFSGFAPHSRDFEAQEIACFDASHRSLDFSGCGEDAAKVVAGKLDDRDAASGEVLLVADVLVGRDEQVEFRFRQPQEITVLDSAPAALRRRGSGVACEQPVHRPWHTFVQQDVHAGASSADSERSRTAQAIARVTDGKHSINSSSV